jgi:hypothetical protein
MLWSFDTTAQSDLFNRFRPAAGPDTIFYPFYNGVQMIEIDYAAEWQANVDFHEGTQPRGMSWAALIPPPEPNLYLFRDSNRNIVKAFNTMQPAAQLTKQFAKVPLHKKNKGLQVLLQCHSCRKSLYSREFGGVKNISSWYGGFYLIYSMRSELKKDGSPFGHGSTKRSGDLVGLIDSLGNIVLPTVYTGIFPVNDDLLVTKNSKCGIINKKLEAILPVEYDHYDIPTETDIVFSLKDKVSCVYNIPQRKIFRMSEYDWIDYDWLERARGHTETNTKEVRLIPVRKGQKTGLLNAGFREVVAPIYDYCIPLFRDGLARVNRDKKWGYINSRGEEVIPSRYEDATDFYQGRATVILDGARICINTKNNKTDSCYDAMSKWEVTPELGARGTLIKGLRIVRRQQFEGVIDSSGRIVVPLIYDDVTGIRDDKEKIGFMQGFYKVRRFKKYGVIDREGKEVLPCEYDYIADFTTELNMTVIGKNEQYGVVDRSFKEILPVKYEGLSPNQIRGKVIFTEKKLYGWMEIDGTVIVPAQYDEVNWMYDGKIRVKKGKSVGIVDVHGKEIIPIKYQLVNDRFYNGLMMTIQNGKAGFLDSTGYEVIPFRYDELRNFEKKITGAKKDGKFGFIDRSGTAVTGFIYDFIDHSWYMDGLVMVRRAGKIGFVDETGKEAIPCIYDEQTGFGPERGHHVKLNNQWIWVKNPN